MRFLSTRGGESVGLVDAVMRGLAADGGLYVPEELPRFSAGDFKGESLRRHRRRLARAVLREARASSARSARSAGERSISRCRCGNSSTRTASSRCSSCFTGRRAAFKDIGARFLAELMERALAVAGDEPRPLTILVATSGDTGGAVAAAFHGRPRHPRRRSVPERAGLAAPAASAHVLGRQHPRVRGRRRVRRLSGAREGGVRRSGLARAPSPHRGQQHQHRPFAAAGRVSRRREPLALAQAWLGFGLDRADRQPRQRRRVRLGARDGTADPRGRVRDQREPHDRRLSLDRAVAAAAEPGRRSRRRWTSATRATWSACAISCPSSGRCAKSVEAYPVDDDAIRSQIAKDYQRYGEIWDPHTATGFWVYDHLPAARKAAKPWIVSATAHPAKFEAVVEPLIGHEVGVPESLRALLERPTSYVALAPKARGAGQRAGQLVIRNLYRTIE